MDLRTLQFHCAHIDVQVESHILLNTQVESHIL